MKKEIIPIHFKEGQYKTYDENLKQWNHSQRLAISGLDISDEIVEVHFSLQEYGGAAKRMVGTVTDGIIHVDIPVFILEGPEWSNDYYSAWAWVYLSDEKSAETIRKIEFTIETRARPDDYVYTEEEIKLWSKLEKEINVVQAKQDFVAEYGVTTYDEIKEAYERGCDVRVKYETDSTKKLEAGTYDADGNLLQSWDELMTVWENHMKSCGLKDCTPDISRTGIIPPYCVSNAIPSEAEMLIISDTVTSIGNYMFYFYGIGKNLRRIIIPESVTDIKTWAFGYQSRLECVSIANNNVSCVSGVFYGITSASIIYYSGTLTASYLTNNTTTPTIMPYEEAPNEALGIVDSLYDLLGSLKVIDNDFVFYTTKNGKLFKIVCGIDGWSSEEFDVALKEDVPTKVSQLENDTGYVNAEELSVVEEKADEALTIAKGATRAFVYDSYSDMIAELNTLGKTKLAVNYHVMIRTLEVPDLWVSEVSETSVIYIHTSDEDLVADLQNDGVVQVGYFVLSALETQKVVLDDYIINPKPQSNAILLLDGGGEGKTSLGYYSNYLPFSGRFYKLAPESEGDTISGDGYFLSNTPTRPYHTANKKYVDDSVPFIATYGVTTYEELKEAQDNGKTIYLIIPKIAVSSNINDNIVIANLARLENDNSDGVTRYIFTFSCDENGVAHYASINWDTKTWAQWDYSYAKAIDVLPRQMSTANANINKLLPLLTSAYNSFRGGFRNNAGTLDIKHPGIYLVLQGGTGDKTMTITQNGTKVYESTCNGWFILSSDNGIITPIGIKSSLTVLGMFETPGTYQGWIKGETTPTHTTKITYPKESVIWYLGNGNNDVGTWN